MRIKQEKIAIIAFIIILFIVVCAPYLWRVALGNTSIAGQQYYIAKGMANEVSKNGMTTFSEYPFSLYILIIGYFDQKQSMLFFMALGIAASALLYLFVRTHKFRPTHSIFIATAWVISYSFASLVYTDGITLFVCVLLLIALLLIRHKKLILAGIFLLLIAATSPVLLFADPITIYKVECELVEA